MAKKKKRRKPPKTSNDYQVFVSHATADKWIATVLCEKMESVGAITFRDDRDIDGGDDIPESIRMQIKRSKEYVVLLTPQSVNRPWVLLEVGAAWLWRRNVRIVALLYHLEMDSIPKMIQSKRAYNLNDVDDYLSELAARIDKQRTKR